MTDDELRALVRSAIARHTGRRPDAPAPDQAPAGRHPSHALFTHAAVAETDGPCLIEPSVLCEHCGYCKSYGH